MYDCVFSHVLFMCMCVCVCMPVQPVCVCSDIRSWIRQACPALCSALCAVFPFKSGRLAHVGSLGFSCCQLSQPWQAVLQIGGGALCSSPHRCLPCCTLSIIKQMGGPVTLTLVQFSNCCSALIQFTRQHLSQACLTACKCKQDSLQYDEQR